MLKNAQLKIDVPALNAAVRDAAYRAGLTDGVSLGLVAGIALTLLATLVFRRLTD